MLRRVMTASSRVALNAGRITSAAVAAHGLFSTSAVAAEGNPKVFFDVAVDGEKLGRLTMELRADGKIATLYRDTFLR